MLSVFAQTMTVTKLLKVKVVNLVFLSVTTQLQVHQHLLLDWRRRESELHTAQRTQTDCNYICDQQRCRHD